VKYTSLQSLGPILGAACLVAACASSGEVDPTIPGEDSGASFVVDSGDGVDSSTATYDSGHPVTQQDTSVADTNTTSSCTGHCTQESDCTAVCSPPNGDVACCDTATSMCYVASGMCQPSTTTPDSGMPAPY
jgi:hypothetical protein